MNRDVFASSKTDEWETPKDFFDKLNEEYNFTLDVCATHQNAKCAKYFTKEMDGLQQTWEGRCWMNPPYGREIGKWMQKAYESVKKGDAELVCCLVPARTDTGWWHDYAMKGRVEFVRGRLKFGQGKNNAPFPSGIVIFGGGTTND